MKLKNTDTKRYIKDKFGTVNLYPRGEKGVSFSFIPPLCTEENACRIIWNIFFNPSNPSEDFKKAFNQAVTGDGNELRKIGALHSSSLLALLCFWKVNVKPITIPVNGKNIIFNKVWFERKNDVLTTDDSPSNIDIVLFSEDAKILLYLESKFTEPLSGGSLNEDRIEKYKTKLEDAGYRFGIEKPKHKKDNPQYRNVLEGKHVSARYYAMYWAGIKQMISHLMGIQTGPSEKDCSNAQKEYKEIYNSQNLKIYLATILYGPKGELLEDKYFEKERIAAYMELHKKSLGNLIKQKNSDSDKDVNIILEPYSYQQVFRNNSDLLEDNVKKLYIIGD